MRILLIVALILLFVFCDKIADFIVTRVRIRRNKQATEDVKKKKAGD